MNRLALALHTFPAANPVLARHWGHFKNAGADEIVAITTTDGGCQVPDECAQEMIGANLYIQSAHLPLRFLRTLKHLLTTKADWFCVAEYDILFFKPIPRDLPEGLTAHLAGHKMPGHHCAHFYHGPWIMDRKTAETMLKAGYQLIEARTVDASPDCFIGQIVEKAGIPVHTDILKSYSRNTIHGETWTMEAVEAVKNGAIAVHGVKTSDVFDALTK